MRKQQEVVVEEIVVLKEGVDLKKMPIMCCFGAYAPGRP